MKRLRQMTAFFLSFVLCWLYLLSGMENILAASVSIGNSVRYSVLILDTSGSMAGEPKKCQKNAAKKFCDSVLHASGENYVAIVKLNTDSSLISEFTNDQKKLEECIDSISAVGGTNTNKALQVAETALDGVVSDGLPVIKNIILCSDGLPESGQRSENGPYTYELGAGYYSYANNAYETALQIKQKSYHIFTLGFFHSLKGQELKFGSRFMSDLADSNMQYYEVTDGDNLEFTFGDIADDVVNAKKEPITFSYASGEQRDYTGTCWYSDSYFEQPSCGKKGLDGYNYSLSTASLCLALSAFGSNEGGNSDYSKKYQNVENLLKEMKFGCFKCNDWYTKKPQSDSIGVAAAKKILNDDSTLIALAVRGGGYESEWAGNFTIGEAGDHYGFAKARDQVISFLKSYIMGDMEGVEKTTGKIKLWITGYSRAAATANLTAAAIDDGALEDVPDVSVAKEDMYAYCFETPMGTLTSKSPESPKYYNIYNIINKNDPVTKVAMSALGFTRYGSDFFLPEKITFGQNYDYALQKMLKYFDNMSSKSETGDYNVDNFEMLKIKLQYILPGGQKPVQVDENNKLIQAEYLDTAIDKLTRERIRTRDNYVQEFQNGIRVIFTAVYGTLFPDQPMERTAKFLEIFINKICSMETLQKIAAAALNPFDNNSMQDVIKKLAESAMNEAGINNVNPISLADFVKSIAELLVAFIVTHPNLSITAVHNWESLKAAHVPELCMAWLMAMDKNYENDPIRFGGSGQYRTIHINCPVDVEVYDENNNLQAKIQNDIPQDIEGSYITASLNEDGEKIVSLPANMSYNISLKATDAGTVNYSVCEYSSSANGVTRIANYKDIHVSEGDLLNAVIPKYSENEQDNNSKYSGTEYLLYDDNNALLAADEVMEGDAAEQAYYMVNVLSDSSDGGIVLGQGMRQSGQFALVEAAANEGYVFTGWFVNGKCISKEAAYRFDVTQDITLIAHFEPLEVHATQIFLDKTTMNIEVNEITSLEAKIIPENASNQTVIWESSDPSVASVHDGIVTALKPGKTFIQASINGAYGLTAQCEVNVMDTDDNEEYPVIKNDISNDAYVVLDQTTFVYDGWQKMPDEVVFLDGEILQKNRDYLIYYQNNTEIGTAKVLIQGIGNCMGSKTKNFKIVPKGVSLSNKIKAKPKGFTVKWKKQGHISGYQVQYSTGRKFKKWKTVTKTIKTSKKHKLTVKKLKAKKKYYIRVRTYKVVNGKKYCSKWSRVKHVKTKK